MNKLDEDFIEKAGKASLVQRSQVDEGKNRLTQIDQKIDYLNELNKKNQKDSEQLLEIMEDFARKECIDLNDYSEETMQMVDQICNIVKQEDKHEAERWEPLDIVSIDETTNWDDYFNHIVKYARRKEINLAVDPFNELLSDEQRETIRKNIKDDYTQKKQNCDHYDYLIAASCGMLAGFIDSFFVGMPGKSKLGSWTDKQTDSIVQSFSKVIWKMDKKNGINLKKEPDSIASAIGYLERRFKVNYDARYASDILNANFKMSSKDHHLKSLGHSPDVIGLFFSLIDQFTGKATFISEGQIIHVETKENGFELKGGNFIAKLFCGFANWIGHILSDIAGSSGVRGHSENSRGAGVPIPFFELFGLCDFGQVDIKGEQKSIAELMISVFNQGYDARFGMAMAIPVLINEIMVRTLWALKRRYYHGCKWTEVMPTTKNPELRRMLVTSHGVLCLIDLGDAAIRSAGELTSFCLHLNYAAWMKLAFSGLKEVTAIYHENIVDLKAFDQDLENEWKRLYLLS
ncbi:MAG: hypothetical protein RSD63_11035 [Eubacterium sp.]